MARRMIALVAPLALGLVTGVPAARAQTMAGPSAAPTYLQITREMVKLGKGEAHEALEHAWANAFAKSDSKIHGIALNPMSGASEVLFVSAFNSMAQLQESNETIAHNKAVTAEIAGYVVKDAEYVSASRTQFWLHRPDLSYRDTVDWGKAHAYQLISVRAGAGHEDDLAAFVTKLREAHRKGGTGAHWAMYEAQFGAPSGSYLVMIPMPSITAIDDGMKDEAKFQGALGAEGGKELARLSATGNLTSTADLYTVSAKMSFVSPSWVAAEPDFWKGSAGVMQAGAPMEAKKPKKP